MDDEEDISEIINQPTLIFTKSGPIIPNMSNLSSAPYTFYTWKIIN